MEKRRSERRGRVDRTRAEQSRAEQSRAEQRGREEIRKVEMDLSFALLCHRKLLLCHGDHCHPVAVFLCGASSSSCQFARQDLQVQSVSSTEEKEEENEQACARLLQSS
eukprot:748277-Hanusia_phi.AAC.1